MAGIRDNNCDYVEQLIDYYDRVILGHLKKYPGTPTYSIVILYALCVVND